MVDNPIEWIKRNFFSKRNFTDVSNGAVDAFRPVVLGIDGYLDPSLLGSFGAWIPLAYTNSGGTTWTDFASGFQIGQYRKFGDLVFVRGLAKRTAGAGTTIATLPADYRPVTYTQLFGTKASGGIARIDIATSGAIIDADAVGATWITLNLVFSIL